MERRLDADHKDDVSPSNMDISVSGRTIPFDVTKYDVSQTVNWFPCEYRLKTEKPWGITVSVGYGECLAKILPYTARHLSKIIVVTTPTDEKTKAVCAQYPQIQVLETELFYEFGAKFNKGLALELATWMLPKDQWCLIFDSDMCLPADMFILERLNKNYIYGAKRALVFDEEQLAKATKERNFNTEGLEVVDLGTIGAFQLFNTSADVLNVRPWYGITYNNASWCDNVFAWKWRPDRRAMLEVSALHLGDRHNWVGEVEGTFPRPNTPYEKVVETDPLPGITTEDALMILFGELKRLKIGRFA
jgi:hypothetical protein